MLSSGLTRKTNKGKRTVSIKIPFYPGILLKTHCLKKNFPKLVLFIHYMFAHFKFKNNNNCNNKMLIPGEMNGAKGQRETG